MSLARPLNRIIAFCALLLGLLAASAQGATYDLTDAPGARVVVYVSRVFGTSVSPPTISTTDLSSRLSGSLSLEPVEISGSTWDALDYSLALDGGPLEITTAAPGTIPVWISFTINELSFGRPGAGQPPALVGSGGAVNFSTGGLGLHSVLHVGGENTVFHDLDLIVSVPRSGTVSHSPSGLVSLSDAGPLQMFEVDTVIMTSELIHLRTSAYLYVDTLVFAPEPGAAPLGALALAGLALARRGARARVRSTTPS